MKVENKTDESLHERIKELEEKLAVYQGKQDLSYLLDNISAIVIVADKNLKPKYATPSFEWFLGHSFDEIKKTSFLDFVHPEDLERVKSVLNMVRKSDGMSLIFPEFRFKHSRGAWLYLEGDVINQLNDESIQGIIMNLYNITQQKLFEIDFARLLAAVRISSDSFMISDNEGNIIFINDATLKLLDTEDKRDIMGKNISSLLDKEELSKLMKEIRGKREFMKRIEHRFITMQGRDIQVESSVSVMRDSEKNQIGYVYVTRDITDRKRDEEELDRYRFHLEELVEARTAELNESMEKLGAILEGIVKSMSYTVESRDLYTAGHQRRVSEIACAIGRELGLSDEVIDGIKMAGLIHDLGKIYVPAEILNKHGPLDDAEFNLVKKHPQVGYDILKSIAFPWPIANIVLQHHERIDGSGYPKGLKGEKILIESKIIGVADVIEAMTIHRPYKKGLGLASALEEIKLNRGTLYDTDVVDACLRLFTEKGYRFH